MYGKSMVSPPQGIGWGNVLSGLGSAAAGIAGALKKPGFGSLSDGLRQMNAYANQPPIAPLP